MGNGYVGARVGMRLIAQNLGNGRVLYVPVQLAYIIRGAGMQLIGNVYLLARLLLGRHIHRGMHVAKIMKRLGQVVYG